MTIGIVTDLWVLENKNANVMMPKDSGVLIHDQLALLLWGLWHGSSLLQKGMEEMEHEST